MLNSGLNRRVTCVKCLFHRENSHGFHAPHSPCGESPGGFHLNGLVHQAADEEVYA